MKTILRLVVKDLIRRCHHPFSTIGVMLIPLAMALLIGLVFGRGNGEEKMPPIKVVLVDLDEGLLTDLLRSAPGQGDLGERITLLVEESVEEGLSTLEDEDASAVIVLPEGLTDDLLDGNKTQLTVYKNPAQTMFPELAVHGARIVALGLSILAREFGAPLREIRNMIDTEEDPPDWKIAALAVSIYSRFRAAEDYLDQPLITFETCSPSEYREQYAEKAKGHAAFKDSEGEEETS